MFNCVLLYMNLILIVMYMQTNMMPILQIFILDLVNAMEA